MMILVLTISGLERIKTSIKTEKNDQENMLTSSRDFIIIGWTKVKLRIAAKLFLWSSICLMSILLFRNRESIDCLKKAL
jgi:hypothetical protein